jgi:hypothetical protein
MPEGFIIFMKISGPRASGHPIGTGSWSQATVGVVATTPRSVENRPCAGSGVDYTRREREGESRMPEVTVVYWRDIPAQVIVGKGRRGSKRQLDERFEQAIDRAAMKVNAKDTDAYLAEWRKAAPYAVEGDPDEVAEAEARRIEAEYDRDRIKSLIDNDGWA